MVVATSKHVGIFTDCVRTLELLIVWCISWAIFRQRT